MARFIEIHPNWDQYRRSGRSGRLPGAERDRIREITRVYVGNMFRRESLLHGV